MTPTTRPKRPAPRDRTKNVASAKRTRIDPRPSDSALQAAEGLLSLAGAPQPATTSLQISTDPHLISAKSPQIAVLSPQISADSPQLSADSPQIAVHSPQISADLTSTSTPVKSTPVKVKVRKMLFGKLKGQNNNNKSNPCLHCSSPLTSQQKKGLHRRGFITEITKSDANCFRYTGIPNVELLHEIFNWVSPAAQTVKLWDGQYKFVPGNGGLTRKAMSLFDEYLVTLVRLRRGYDVEHMAYLFAVSKSQISRIFITWVNLLYQCLQPLLKWPSRDLLEANMPSTFKAYPRTRVIIDATEFHIEKPFRPHAQKRTWSNYKQANTFKLLVGIMPSGAITFLSKLYNGAISDQHITEKSGLLDLLEEGDDVMADRGFNIRHLLLTKKCTLNIPSFSHGKVMSSKALKRSRKIAQVRIHVERAIRRMKTFKILSGTIPLRLRYCLDQIITIVSVLCNLQKRLAT